MEGFLDNVLVFKALSHPVRAKIVEMLSNEELNACRIIEEFHLSQSTISHHMKLLCESGIVNARSESNWIYYSLNKDTVQRVNQFYLDITSFKNSRME